MKDGGYPFRAHRSQAEVLRDEAVTAAGAEAIPARAIETPAETLDRARTVLGRQLREISEGLDHIPSLIEQAKAQAREKTLTEVIELLRPLRKIPETAAETEQDFLRWLAEAPAGARCVYWAGAMLRRTDARIPVAALAWQAERDGAVQLFQRREPAGSFVYIAVRCPRTLGPVPRSVP